MAVRKPSKSRAAASTRRPTGVQLGDDVVRDTVLVGAARVFATRGVRNASMVEILEASRISRRTFYRVYDNKEAVMLALYRIGTDRLVDACRTAVENEKDPLRQVERCIDGHLRNAREQGRLMFVLGAEAQHNESLLHARRLDVHEELASLLARGAAGAGSPPPDPFVFRALLLAFEGVTRLALTEGDEGRDVSAASLDRTRRVMLRLATATLRGEGPGVAPLPTAR